MFCSMAYWYTFFQEGNGSLSSPNGNQGEEKVSGRPAGGGGLEKLTREELVTKCRNLLALAQRAKAAKDGKTV